MLLLLWLACSPTPRNSIDTDTPFCARVHVDADTVVCTATNQPAYSCADNTDCWFDAGGDAIWHFDCNRPADEDDARQALTDYCGGFTVVQ